MSTLLAFKTWGALALLFLLPTRGSGQSLPSADEALAVRFEGGYGQLEIGGPYVGAEFHHSRPLPSRISFYYPVANSIDLSTDYWQRDASQPLIVTLSVDGKTETIGQAPFPYRWTPHHAVFEQSTPAYRTEVAYAFADDLPVMVLRLTIQNRSAETKAFRLSTRLNTTLRTSHAYAVRDSARTSYVDDGSVFLARFDDADTDSALVFVANVGEPPIGWGLATEAESVEEPVAAFEYAKTLAPQEELVIIQLIGSCRQVEAEAMLQRARSTWQQSVQAYDQRVSDYVAQNATPAVRDAALAHTARWSKALLQANRHYLDGRVVPMPCPAEYNFFFTHDLLLTDLGAVFFDTDRVRNDLLYLYSLARPDSVLPHAYYWRDDGYKTEFAQSDNWNHLWFILLSGAYLRHSGDVETITQLYPMLQKSLVLMLENERDGLMYATRPDWWDIGHVYGARAYLTTLMVRALETYVFISLHLERPEPSLRRYIYLAGRMRRQLVARLWDEDTGYLLNMIDSTTVDRHYYTGSLLAAAFGLLDDAKTQRLIATARKELLDEHIGIRNAMPADFHELIDVYRFNGLEGGAPYVYLNGGVWPQGIAWYAMALLAADQPEAASGVLKEYLTLEGIQNSPNGQPAFFEYRNADPHSDAYGQIDKPTFLWAGGWFLHVLYQLGGVRERAWNVSFDPHMPESFDDVHYDLMLFGQQARVRWSGEGVYFKRIAVDGKDVHTAILVGPAVSVELERGRPESPYLAEASGIIRRVTYQAANNTLQVTVAGLPGQEVDLEVIAPAPLRRVLIDEGGRQAGEPMTTEDDGTVIVATSVRLAAPGAQVTFQFQSRSGGQ